MLSGSPSMGAAPPLMGRSLIYSFHGSTLARCSAFQNSILGRAPRRRLTRSESNGHFVPNRYTPVHSTESGERDPFCSPYNQRLTIFKKPPLAQIRFCKSPALCALRRKNYRYSRWPHASGAAKGLTGGQFVSRRGARKTPGSCRIEILKNWVTKHHAFPPTLYWMSRYFERALGETQQLQLVDAQQQ
jgi:hypothetical protein